MWRRERNRYVCLILFNSPAQNYLETSAWSANGPTLESVRVWGDACSGDVPEVHACRPSTNNMYSI